MREETGGGGGESRQLSQTQARHAHILLRCNGKNRQSCRIRVTLCAILWFIWGCFWNQSHPVLRFAESVIDKGLKIFS